jgi:N-acetyl-anhydromuramyl-L-alanine amidase AmpD
MIFLLGCFVGAEDFKGPTPPTETPVEVVGEAAATPAVEAPAYTDRLLPFDAERARLTLDYRRQHQGYTGNSVEIEPKVVVLHWTGGSSVDSAWNTFAPTKAEDARPELAAQGAVNVSAHFLVGQDGAAFRLLPETTYARHCIGLNHVAVGIENVGTGELGSAGGLTMSQVESNVRLIQYLKERWPIEQVIGHLEYRSLEGTSLFLELDPKYRTGKADPGERFMEEVRRRL